MSVSLPFWLATDVKVQVHSETYFWFKSINLGWPTSFEDESEDDVRESDMAGVGVSTNVSCRIAFDVKYTFKWINVMLN